CDAGGGDVGVEVCGVCGAVVGEPEPGLEPGLEPGKSVLCGGPGAVGAAACPDTVSVQPASSNPAAARPAARIVRIPARRGLVRPGSARRGRARPSSPRAARPPRRPGTASTG